ncbi:MAG: peptide-methionine (S)-S-oxide reductase, partial [Mycobacterium sp.]
MHPIRAARQIHPTNGPWPVDLVSWPQPVPARQHGFGHFLPGGTGCGDRRPWIDREGRTRITTYSGAILAGGCFWGMQELIRKRSDVVSTRVGYTGGDANA